MSSIAPWIRLPLPGAAAARSRHVHPSLPGSSIVRGFLCRRIAGIHRFRELPLLPHHRDPLALPPDRVVFGSGSAHLRFVVMASKSASINDSVGMVASHAAPAPSIEGRAAPTEGAFSIGSGTQENAL